MVQAIASWPSKRKALCSNPNPNTTKQMSKTKEIFDDFFFLAKNVPHVVFPSYSFIS
jgi:hypothetical protein